MTFGFDPEFYWYINIGKAELGTLIIDVVRYSPEIYRIGFYVCNVTIGIKVMGAYANPSGEING